MVEPMYLRIAQELRSRIEEGTLGPGAQLPTESELRERYKASRNTIRDAIRWLMSNGLVETRPGQGTYVTNKIDPFVTVLTDDPGTGPPGGEGSSYLSRVSKANRKPSSSPPEVGIQHAAGLIAARLRIPEGTSVISRQERRFIDGTPWLMQTSFYPMEFAVRGAARLLDANDIEEGTVRYLADVLDLKQVGYRDWISVRVPNSIEAEFFKIPIDGRVTVFDLLRVAFDESGAPMRVTVTIFPADRNQFIVNVGDVPPPLDLPDSLIPPAGS
jgi:DNA-binding GntR family transcriptional regulator